MRNNLRTFLVFCSCLMFSAISAYGATYTTISDGNWSNPATWSGGLVPSTVAIPAGDTINVNHIVVFDLGTDINNSGTIRIERIGGGTAWLKIPNNIQVNNLATGFLYVTNARLIQCRFASCDNGEPYTGTTPDTDAQTGVWRNTRGTIEVNGSIVEVAESWINEHGFRKIIDSCVFTGKDYQLIDGAEEITRSLISAGWHGNGGFVVGGSAAITYTNARIQLAGATGSFTQTAVDTHNGSIDNILIRNQVGNFIGSGEIRNDAGMPGGPVVLGSYCAQSTAKYIPNGEFTLPAGTPPVCGTQPFCVGVIIVTAAHVPVSGRVTNASGTGIGGVSVTITGGDLQEPVRSLTNAFGYYLIPDLEVGHTYVAEVSSKRYQFSSPTVVFNLLDELTGLDFVADGGAGKVTSGPSVKGREPLRR